MPFKKQRLAEIPGPWTASEISVNFKPGIKSDIFIADSRDAFSFIRSIWDNERINLQEQFLAVFINRRHKTIGYRLICTSRMYETPIDIRLIASLALHSMATFVIVAHNHPLGGLTLSDADLKSTKRIKKALKLIEVTLWDHLIISDTEYLSMADECYI